MEDGRNPCWIRVWSHWNHCFIYPRWCRISSINSKSTNSQITSWMPFVLQNHHSKTFVYRFPWRNHLCSKMQSLQDQPSFKSSASWRVQVSGLFPTLPKKPKWSHPGNIPLQHSGELDKSATQYSSSGLQIITLSVFPRSSAMQASHCHKWTQTTTLPSRELTYPPFLRHIWRWFSSSQRGTG